MKTLEDWYRHLEEHPDDWECRLVLADWLDDQGLDVLAAGQRWQAREHARPMGGTHWYNAEHYRAGKDQLPPGPEDLPRETFLAMKQPPEERREGRADWNAWWRQCSCMAQAERALAEALHVTGYPAVPKAPGRKEVTSGLAAGDEGGVVR